MEDSKITICNHVNTF